MNRTISASPRYHPVVVFPRSAQVEVTDLTTAEGAARPAPVWGVGKYDEKRAGLYVHELFKGEAGERRDVHVGVDLFAPAGVAVHAFADGVVVQAGMNGQPGDYGPVLVVRHALAGGGGGGGTPVYALYGHLSVETLLRSRVGREVRSGDVLGWVGSSAVNGGWAPHVHFQLAWDAPPTHDMPGVVRWSERGDALRKYPDPRPALGLGEDFRQKL